jgi:hypothetical protein
VKERKGRERKGKKGEGAIVLWGAERYVEIRASCTGAMALGQDKMRQDGMR